MNYERYETRCSRNVILCWRHMHSNAYVRKTGNICNLLTTPVGKLKSTIDVLLPYPHTSTFSWRLFMSSLVCCVHHAKHGRDKTDMKAGLPQVGASKGWVGSSGRKASHDGTALAVPSPRRAFWPRRCQEVRWGESFSTWAGGAGAGGFLKGGKAEPLDCGATRWVKREIPKCHFKVSTMQRWFPPNTIYPHYSVICDKIRIWGWLICVSLQSCERMVIYFVFCLFLQKHTMF